MSDKFQMKNKIKNYAFTLRVNINEMRLIVKQ